VNDSKKDLVAIYNIWSILRSTVWGILKEIKEISVDYFY